MGIEADLSERELQCVDMEIWPENEAPLAVFCAMLTQWHRNGMIYSALPPVFRYLGIPRSDQPAVFADLQILESTTIQVLKAKHG